MIHTPPCRASLASYCSRVSPYFLRLNLRWVLGRSARRLARNSGSVEYLCRRRAFLMSLCLRALARLLAFILSRYSGSSAYRCFLRSHSRRLPASDFFSVFFLAVTVERLP